MLIHGSCHCGNISFRLTWSPEPVEIPARACTCSFCSKHGGVWTSCATGSVTVAIQEPKHVSQYSFGTRTAEFHICTTCGVVPIVTSRIGGNLYAVVSVNALEGLDPSLLKQGVVTFDDEPEEARLARRARNWIPSVVFDGDT